MSSLVEGAHSLFVVARAGLQDTDPAEGAGQLSLRFEIRGAFVSQGT